jgi:hypothetical protein
MQYMKGNAANQASNNMNLCTAFITIVAEKYSNTNRESDHITSDEWYSTLDRFNIFDTQRAVHRDIFL